MNSLLVALQVSLSLAVLNVWLLRRQRVSRWRGGAARDLAEEFSAYGLPSWAMPTVGVVKVSCAFVLLAGVFMPDLVKPAAACLAALMLGAVVMHIKISDPPRKSLPAAALFALALSIALFPAANGR